MAAKFYIYKKLRLSNDGHYYEWNLTEDGDILAFNGNPLHTEAEARAEISRLKRAVRKFTKVEVIDAE